jgi:hypothetical protein
MPPNMYGTVLKGNNLKSWQCSMDLLMKRCSYTVDASEYSTKGKYSQELAVFFGLVNEKLL